MKAETAANGAVRAAVYARTSSDDLSDPKLSTSSQVQDGRTLAETLGMTVADESVFIDMDLSGSLPPTRWQTHRRTLHNHRPALERLMVAIESGKVQAVVIRKRDRLFRHLEDSLRFFRFLETHKVNCMRLLREST
jgi:DNA invertase Pin-like site-specific DNA recombinase